jgi:hypothetical protein
MSDPTNNSGPQSGNQPEKKEEKDRKVAGFWWWSPAYLAAAVLAVTVGYFYYLMHLKHEPKPVQAAAPAQQPAQPVHVVREKIESAYFFRIDGKDTQGRAASFDFIVLTGDYTWALGSTTEVVSKGAAVPEAEAAERVLSPKIRESLSSASDLISVGLASQEGEREAEEARALARSQTIGGWLAKIAGPSTGLWSLTLGQYKGCKQQQDEDTSFERPLILAGVRAKAEGANLQEALADAVSGHDNLPSRECYSRFDMTKAR